MTASITTMLKTLFITICLINATVGKTRFTRGYLAGYYCVSDYFKTVHNISQHICTLLCMDSELCYVLAYHHHSHICSLGHKPCVIAEPREDYLTMVLRNDVECLVWHQWDKSRDSPRVVRSGSMTRSVARKVDGNTIYVGVMNAPWPGNGNGYFVVEGMETEMTGGESLSVHPNCSLAWAPYTVGEPLPKWAVITGIIDGRAAYSIQVESDETFGGYIAGDPTGFYGHYGFHECLGFDVLIHV